MMNTYNPGDPYQPQSQFASPASLKPGKGPAQTSGYAITSLILGVASLVCAFVTGIVGVVFGIMALSQISGSHGQIKGKGLAITGICLSLSMSIVIPIVMLVAMLLPAVQQVREAARRVDAQNNVRQILLAHHNYADANNELPKSAGDWEGRGAGLSWRVHLLPYLEEQELYEQFNLDEPWDSDHNVALIPLMPATYDSLGIELQSGKTVMLRPIGNGAFPAPEDVSNGRQLRLMDITDGTSNTIMVVEADSELQVTWTQPADYRFEPSEPKRGLGNARAGGFVAGFADGSCIFVPKNSAPNQIEALFTIAGGEVPDFEF